MAVNWPHARTLLCVESTFGTKKKPETTERRYYISSIERNQRTSSQWLSLVRGHWGGVEIRNHWRKDACWMEDKTRSRNRNIVGILALLRNALFAVISDQLELSGSLPAFFDECQHRPTKALHLIRSNL